MPGPFVIARDPRGSLVQLRKSDGECVGCIEVGLFEIVRSLILTDERAAPDATRDSGQHRASSRKNCSAGRRQRHE